MNASELVKPTDFVVMTLAADLNVGVTSEMDVNEDVSDLESAGWAVIRDPVGGDEVVKWTGKDEANDKLTGLTRGVSGSDATHAASDVTAVYGSATSAAYLGQIVDFLQNPTFEAFAFEHAGNDVTLKNPTTHSDGDGSQGDGSPRLVFIGNWFNDSADTNTELKMQLELVPEASSFYRLSLKDNGGAEKFSFDQSGNFALNGNIDMSFGTIDSPGTILFKSNSAVIDVQGAFTTGDKVEWRVMDLGSVSQTTFVTATVGDPATFDLSTAVTMGGNAIYYASGSDVAVADGGTGASDASGARSNLGLVIGNHVQAHGAVLDDLAGLTLTKGDILVYDGSNLAKLDIGLDGQVLTLDSATSTGLQWAAAGSGSAIVLDLGDDSTNESSDLTEIATTGDTNSIFSEPSADKLLIDVSRQWPVATDIGRLTTLGDIAYHDGGNTARLAGNTATTKKFLVQTGDGANSAAPAWNTLAAGDLPSHTHTESEISDLKNYADLDDTGAQTFSGDITISGNLTVQGSATEIQTSELNVDDNIIRLNDGVTGSPSLNAGIEVERGTSADVQLRWNETTDTWQVTEDGTNFYNLWHANNLIIGTDVAAASHNHAAGDIDSGTFADARIAQSNVTQHEASLTITESQISDLGNYLLNITGESLSDLSDVTITSIASGEVLRWDGEKWINNTLGEAGIAATGHSHAAGDVTSGTFADARIAQSSVTQHEAALTITESQISDLGSYQAADSDLTTIAGFGKTKGRVMVANGTNWVALDVGADDEVLTADSAQASGVKWATGGGGGSSPWTDDDPGASIGDTFTASSGTETQLSITPTINQTSTAGYTAIHVDVTETATGSGSTKLLDLQVGSSTMFSVDNAGNLIFAGGAPIKQWDTTGLSIGIDAGDGSDAGVNGSVIIGRRAGFDITSGNNNTLIGARAGESLTTNSVNVIIGSSAGQDIDAGANVLIGDTAGKRAGSNNVFIGRQCAFGSTSGSPTNSVGVGSQALRSIQGGAGNTAVGYRAGYAPNGTTGNATTTGANNTFLGFETGFASSTQRSQAIAIGYNAVVDADNVAVIGGIGSDSIKLGLNITAPTAQLHQVINDAGDIGHLIKHAATPTADMLRLLDSSDTFLGGFNKDGYFITKKNAAPADGDLDASELALWFDDTNGSAKLMVKAKQADGTVVTGNVALS